MEDFLAALGLVFVIEGLVFAAFPGPAKRAMAINIEITSPHRVIRSYKLSSIFNIQTQW
jgi:uncharacterized protein YjeT (DUF2065 family)